MIEVAKLFKDQYECHFFSYGGQFEELVEEAGFILHRLVPKEGPENLPDSYYRQKAKEAQSILNGVNTGEIINKIFSEHPSEKF
jgi:hypothetical protein